MGAQCIVVDNDSLTASYSFLSMLSTSDRREVVNMAHCLFYQYFHAIPFSFIRKEYVVQKSFYTTTFLYRA